MNWLVTLLSTLTDRDFVCIRYVNFDLCPQVIMHVCVLGNPLVVVSSEHGLLLAFYTERKMKM